MHINTAIITIDNTIETGSNFPSESICLASKYLNGVIYFKLVNLSFKSISIESKYVPNNTPVAADAAPLGFFASAPNPEPMNRNINCTKNIPIIRSTMKLVIEAPLL